MILNCCKINLYEYFNNICYWYEFINRYILIVESSKFKNQYNYYSMSKPNRIAIEMYTDTV